MCGFSLRGFWLGKSELTPAQGTDELVTPPDVPHLALLARVYRGIEDRGDQLPSGAQLFFAVCFDWHLANNHESI